MIDCQFYILLEWMPQEGGKLEHKWWDWGHESGAIPEMSGRLPRTSKLTKGMGIPANCAKTNTHKTHSEFASPLTRLHTQRYQVLFQGCHGYLYPPLTNTLCLVLRNLMWPLSYRNTTTRRRQAQRYSSSLHASERSRLDQFNGVA